MNNELDNLVWEQDNEVFFYAEVVPETVNKLMKILYKKRNMKNTILHIKSHGGQVDEMLSIIDLIKNYDIHVHVDGYAMSAAFVIFCAAKKRSMSKYARLMYHDISFASDYKTLYEHKEHILESENLLKLCDKIILDTKSFTKQELEAIRNSKKDYFIYYDEAVERGLVNTTLNVDKQNFNISEIEIEEEE